MKAPATTSQPNHLPRKKAILLSSEAEVIAIKQQRFQEVFGGVDWEQARRTIAETKAATQ